MDTPTEKVVDAACAFVHAYLPTLGINLGELDEAGYVRLLEWLTRDALEARGRGQARPGNTSWR